MKIRAIFSILIVFFAVVSIAVTQDYSVIGDCDYFGGSGIDDNITFICGDISAYANKFFALGVRSFCRNQQTSLNPNGYSHRWIVRVNFKNCDRPQISENFLQDYFNVHSELK